MKIRELATRRWRVNPVWRSALSIFFSGAGLAAIGEGIKKGDWVQIGIAGPLWIIIGGVTYFTPSLEERERLYNLSDEELRAKVRDLIRDGKMVVDTTANK